MSVDSRRGSAIVIGGSIGGLLVGLLLRRHGWHVEIFESTTELDGRGAGIVTHQALFDVLDTLGLGDADNIGLPIQTRKVLDRSGAVVASLELPQTVTSWGRLHQVLLSAFPAQHYHCAKTLVQIEAGASDVSCRFADGTVETAPLVVGADGIRSATRQHFEPDSQPVYAGYVAWRGLVDEHHFNTTALQNVFPFFTFCLPPGEQMLAYPVAGKNFTTAKWQRRCNAVWYRQADPQNELQTLLTDTDGRNNGLSIAPNKVRPEVVAQMRAAASQRLSPQHAAIVELMEQPFLQPIYDVFSASMVHGRVVLIGDAAFTARPHLGMGVTKVAEDAQALTDCLASEQDVPAALAAFREVRQPVNELIVMRSRQLGSGLQPGVVEGAEDFGSVESVLRETATDDYIRAFVKAREPAA